MSPKVLDSVKVDNFYPPASLEKQALSLPETDNFYPPSPLQSPLEVAGAIKALEAVSSFSNAMSAVQLLRVKEMYESKDIPVDLEQNYGPTFRTFCGTVGIPHPTAKLKVRDIREFGLDMLQRVEALNLPMSTLRQVRSFPETQKQEVMQFLMSAEAGSREVIKDYIGQLQAENARLEKLAGAEKALLETENVQLKAETETQGKLSSELKKEKKNLSRQLEKMSPEYEAGKLLEAMTQLQLRYHTLKDRAHANEAMWDDLDAFRAVVESVAREPMR